MNAPWPQEPRELARAVLAQPIYRASDVPPQRSLLDALAEQVERLWSRIADALAHARGGQRLADAIGLAVLVLALVALSLAGMRVARRIARARRARAAAAAAPQAADAGAAALHQSALAAAAEGRHRDAAALLWRAAQCALSEAGRVHDDPARTPGEWRRSVADPAFDALARDAVVALFARTDVDAALVGRMREAYDRLART